jgi:hypothetical protein
MKSLLVLLVVAAFASVQGQFDCSAPPDCTVASNRQTLWPHAKPTIFYRCELKAAKWTAVEQSCQCGNLFSFIGRGCVTPDRWMRVCTSHEENPKPDSCTEVPTSAPTTAPPPGVPTDPPAGPTTPPPAGPTTPPPSQPPTVPQVP